MAPITLRVFEMRLLFVTPTDLSAPRGGRAMLARLHRDALSAMVGDGFAEHRVGDDGMASVRLRLGGHIDGATRAGALATIAAIDAHQADLVWLDGSNLGRLAEALRAARPEVRLLTFCHNVEARFFLGAWRRRPGVRAAGTLIGNAIAERLAMRCSDDVIALSTRDAAGLARLYGRAADHILPMAVTDQLTAPPPPNALVANDAPFLFVGGAFYANQAGIAWFAREVASRVNARIVIVGQGMAAMRTELSVAGNIEVIGAVDDLEPHYRAARATLAPIFDGSGMKTKVAEALMFGKRVIGTPEAFSGYEAVAGRAGVLCRTATDFVRAIGEAQRDATKTLDPFLRALYERNFSAEATTRRLAAILQGAR